MLIKKILLTVPVILLTAFFCPINAAHAYTDYQNHNNSHPDNQYPIDRKVTVQGPRGYATMTYYRVDSDELKHREELRKDMYVDVKSKNLALYYYLHLFNPPFLNNIFFTAIFFMIAVGLLFTLGTFEADARILLTILCIYAWGHIVGTMIMISLVGQGVLPP